MPETVLELEALEQLMQDLGGSREPVRDLVRTYLAEAPLAVARLRHAIEGGNGTDLASAAHSLKSSSALVGAKKVSAIAVELERIGRSGSIAGAAERFAVLRTLVPRVERELRAWMAA